MLVCSMYIDKYRVQIERDTKLHILGEDLTRICRDWERIQKLHKYRWRSPIFLALSP